MPSEPRTPVEVKSPKSAGLLAAPVETGRSSEPVTGLTPIEQARWQRTPVAQRHCEASLRHLEKVLRTASLDRFAAPCRG